MLGERMANHRQYVHALTFHRRKATEDHFKAEIEKIYASLV